MTFEEFFTKYKIGKLRDKNVIKETRINMKSQNAERICCKTPRLIDEWQLAPKLWDAVRYEVDKRDDFTQIRDDMKANDTDSLNEDTVFSYIADRTEFL